MCASAPSQPRAPRQLSLLAARPGGLLVCSAPAAVAVCALLCRLPAALVAVARGGSAAYEGAAAPTLARRKASLLASLLARRPLRSSRRAAGPNLRLAVRAIAARSARGLRPSAGLAVRIAGRTSGPAQARRSALSLSFAFHRVSDLSSLSSSARLGLASLSLSLFS